MATRSVQDAIINVVINGEQAIKSFKELNQERARQLSLVQSLNRNSPEYDQQRRRLEDLNAAHRAWREEINNNTAALARLDGEMEQTGKNGFFDKIKSFFSGDTLKFAAGNLIAGGISTAVSAIKSFVGSSEEAYVEAVKGQAQLDAALKSTQGVAGQTKQSLADMATALMNQTGVDDDVISKGEQMLLTFTNIRGKIYEQALPSIVDMTSAMNQGTVSMEGIQATSIQVGKALNDPIKGITSLAKVGVTFTEQQKEQIKTLVEHNKMQEAQAIILRELQKEFGGVAKSMADTDAGAMQKFETRLGNIQETIGKWITKGKVLLVEFLEPIIAWFEKFINNLDQSKGPAAKFKTTFTEIGRIFSEIWTIVKPLGESIAKVFTQSAALDFFKNTLNNILIPLRTIALVIKDLKNGQWGKAFEDGTKGMIDFQKNLVATAKSSVRLTKDIVVGVVDGLAAGGDALSKKTGAAKPGKPQADSTTGTGSSSGNPPATAPQSGPTAAQLAKAQAAREKEKAAQQRHNKEMEDIQSAYLDIAAKARKGDVDGLDAQLKVVDDKFNKLVERIKKTLADKHTTGKEKTALTGILQGIDGPDGARKKEKDNVTEEFNKKQLEATKKYNEEQRKEAEGFNKSLEGLIDQAFEKQATALQDQQTEELSNTDLTEQQRLDIKAKYQEMELEMELKHFQALKELQVAAGKDTTAIDNQISATKKKIGENDYQNKKDTVDKQTKLDEKRFELARQITNGLASLIDVTMGNSAMGVEFQKAITVAQIAIDTASAISSTVREMTKGSLSPIDYAIKVASMIAVVFASMAKAKSALSSGKETQPQKTQKYAQGGILPDGPSHASGGIQLTGPYGMVYGEIEGGEPVLSKRTYANNKGIIDALLSSGGRQLNFDRINQATTSREQRNSYLPASQAQAAAPVAGNDATALLIGQFQQMHSVLQAIQQGQGNQKVILSRRLFEREDAKVAKIRNDANA